ncbi:MAG: hypothetical protein QM831_46005 [Kofleriaceae bacterium]
MLILPACTSVDTEPSAIATQLASGNGVSFALTSTGSVRAWGYPDTSGIATTDRIQAPTTIPGLEAGVAGISSYGGDDACVVMTDGTVQCWGANDDGEVGTGDTSMVVTPTPVAGISGATEVAMGGTFACALVGDGVQCWGSNASHQLGIGDGSDGAPAPDHAYTPVVVAGLEHGVARIATGYDHLCASMTDGRLICVGSNALGELGISSDADPTHVDIQPSNAGDPLIATPGITATSVGLGYHWSVVATTSGQVKVFGDNDDGDQLGLGPDGPFQEQLSPVNILDVPASATNVSAMCAVASGDVWCWAGSSTSSDPSTPAKVAGLANITQISGDISPCALDGNGAVFCWGEGANYQLGDGHAYDATVTTPVAVLSFP